MWRAMTCHAPPACRCPALRVMVQRSGVGPLETAAIPTCLAQHPWCPHLWHPSSVGQPTQWSTGWSLLWQHGTTHWQPPGYPSWAGMQVDMGCFGAVWEDPKCCQLSRLSPYSDSTPRELSNATSWASFGLKSTQKWPFYSKQQICSRVPLPIPLSPTLPFLPPSLSTTPPSPLCIRV